MKGCMWVCVGEHVWPSGMIGVKPQVGRGVLKLSERRYETHLRSYSFTETGIRLSSFISLWWESHQTPRVLYLSVAFEKQTM